MKEKIKIAFMSIILGIGLISIVYCLYMLIVKQDHVMDKPPREIDGHVYKRIYSLGSSYLVDDIENCPKCKTYIIHIADSIARSQY
jgi:hypothetical protein